MSKSIFKHESTSKIKWRGQLTHLIDRLKIIILIEKYYYYIYKFIDYYYFDDEIHEVKFLFLKKKKMLVSLLHKLKIYSYYVVLLCHVISIIL